MPSEGKFCRRRIKKFKYWFIYSNCNINLYLKLFLLEYLCQKGFYKAGIKQGDDELF